MTKRRTDNTMTKRRGDNTMTKRRTDNTMTKRRGDNTMSNGQRTKGRTTIYKTLHRNIAIEQSEPFLNPVVNSAAPEP
jgi:hypothetical protein